MSFQTVLLILYNLQFKNTFKSVSNYIKYSSEILIEKTLNEEINWSRIDIFIIVNSTIQEHRISTNLLRTSILFLINF